MKLARIALAVSIVLLVALVVFMVVTLLNPQIGAVYSMCTAMGCTDGVAVRFTGDIPDDYTADVVGSGGGRWGMSCSLSPGSAIGMGCMVGGGVEIHNVTPEQLTVTVRWDGGSKTETFRPVYKTLQPNGPHCEPTCHSAMLTMSLP